MKYFLTLAFMATHTLTFSQRLHADLYAGIANYEGDLQGKRFALSNTFTNPYPAVGLGLSYNLSNRIIARFVVNYLRLGADDKNNEPGIGINRRNLNFKTNIFEGQLGAEYNLLDLSVRSFTPYVFAAVAIYHFNPYSTDTLGNKVFLKPLSTEGQGLAEYPNRKPYALTQLAIPFGGGVKLALTDKLQVGIELGLRKLFTDYLDDVSTSYVDSATLFATKGPQAVAFAYRGNEIHGAAGYPAEGSQRGSPKNKDWYYTASFRISYLLFANRDANGFKNRTGCPKSVY